MAALDLLSVAANVLTAVAVVAGLIFGIVQIRQSQTRAREAAAIETVHSYQDFQFVHAFTRVKNMPPDPDWGALRHKEPEIENAALTLVMVFEGLGVLVHQRVVPIETVEQLMGGMVRTSWERLRSYAALRRKESGTGKPLEWTQWLAERMAERAQARPRQLEGAHVLYRDWEP